MKMVPRLQQEYSHDNPFLRTTVPDWATRLATTIMVKKGAAATPVNGTLRLPNPIHSASIAVVKSGGNVVFFPSSYDRKVKSRHWAAQERYTNHTFMESSRASAQHTLHNSVDVGATMYASHNSGKFSRTAVQPTAGKLSARATVMHCCRL
jgi:hypothetical protein